LPTTLVKIIATRSDLLLQLLGRAERDIRSIAEILAWDEEGVEKIINRYVGNNAATLALINQLDESGTKSARRVQD
jgi:hypothetical protein